MSRQASVGSWIGAVVVVLAVLMAGAYLAYKATHPGTPTSNSTMSPAAPASTPASAATALIQHPIVQAAVPAHASTAPLPALDDSDANVAAALITLAGDADLRSLLLPQQIIARIVATIDTLPRHELGTLMLPLHTPKGAFVTAEVDGQTVMGEQNAARYAPYMQIVGHADPKTLVAWYVHAYPLFQQAYRQLGYPRGYFNDRLIAAIDDMLAAPESFQPAVLVRSHGFYVYADPSLESLSAGQRLLLRVGPANAAIIKVKLRSIRAQLTGRTWPASPPPASTARP